jgi:hypothetical protein
MAKSFEDLINKTCSKDVIIEGYKKTMDYFAEYIGMSPKQANVLPDGFSTIRIKDKQFKRRDPSRRW